MQSGAGWLWATRPEEALGVPHKVLHNPLAKGLGAERSPTPLEPHIQFCNGTFPAPAAGAGCQEMGRELVSWHQGGREARRQRQAPPRGTRGPRFNVSSTLSSSGYEGRELGTRGRGSWAAGAAVSLSLAPRART